MKAELRTLQQKLQAKDTELAQAQQNDAQMAQLEAVRQELAGNLTLAQDALQV